LVAAAKRRRLSLHASLIEALTHAVDGSGRVAKAEVSQ
jgi:hypothetical protein